MCIQEVLDCCTQCASQCENHCRFMQGKHTWYQAGITIFSLIQTIFQFVHIFNLRNAVDQFSKIKFSCTDLDATELANLNKVDSSIKALNRDENLLAYMSISYFAFLLLFLIIFDFCKVEEKCAKSDPDKFQNNQFKCRQIFKAILQIAFVGLIAKVLMTANANKKIIDSISDISCSNLGTKIKKTITTFDTSIYTEALINLGFFVLQLCLDYNCLLFPHVRAHYLLFQAEEMDMQRKEDERIERMKQKRRGANKTDNVNGESGQPAPKRRMTMMPPAYIQQKIQQGEVQTSGPFQWPVAQ